MALTGPQIEELQNALLSAFDDDSLEQLTRFDLNVRLDDVAPAANLKTRVFKLLEWSERNGRTHDLVRAALMRNPGNTALGALAWTRLSGYGSGDPLAVPPPYDLPAAPANLIGRDRQLTQAMQLLRQGNAMISFRGGIGMGKAALARSVAHASLREQLFDTCFCWSAGYEKVDTAKFLSELGGFLHGAQLSSPGGSYTPNQVYRLLRTYKVLLVVTTITQSMHPELVSFLHATPQNVSVITTSTELIPGATKNITVNGFTDEQAFDYLRSQLAALDLDDEMDLDTVIAHELNDICGGAPALLWLVVSYLAKRYRPREIITIFRSGDTDVDNPILPMCRYIYQQLDENARLALRIICDSPDQITGRDLMQHLGVSDPLQLRRQFVGPLHTWSLLSESKAEMLQDTLFAPSNDPTRRSFLSFFR